MATQAQDHQHASVTVAERAGYFPVSGAHLYTVLHEVINPVARVLLVGPSASERHLSYRPWVQWARYLAARGFEVLRYDYRGVGESTGCFEEMSFDSWMNDITCLSAWLKARGQNTPLVLHGLELGGVLASRSFENLGADALILWSAAANANTVLRSALQRWLGPQQMLKPVEERRPPSHYFRCLDEGQSVEIEGYTWTSALWRQSSSFELPAELRQPGDHLEYCGKPVHVVSLGRNAAPLVKGAVPGYDENKNFDWLFAANHRWIVSHLSLPSEAA